MALVSKVSLCPPGGRDPAGNRMLGQLRSRGASPLPSCRPQAHRPRGVGPGLGGDETTRPRPWALRDGLLHRGQRAVSRNVSAGPGAARPLRCFSAPFPRVSAFPSAATSRQERGTPSASTVVSADDAPRSEAEHERVLTGNKSTSFKCAGSLKPRLRKVKLLSEWQVALRDAWTAPNRTCCSCQPH